MKTLIITLALLANSLVNVVAVSTGAASTGAAPRPDEPKTHKLTVSIANIEQRTGCLYVGVYNNDPALNGATFRRVRVAIPPTGNVSVSLDDMPGGRYAVKMYQDLNGNMKLDYNGPMPSEPYGFSNVTQVMGPPSFEQLAFTLNGEKAIEVKLIN